MAITEKYVSSAGGGAHDGSSEADAFSWAEMITDINAGSKAGNRYNVKGTISRTTTTDTLSAGGSSTSPVIIRGYSSAIGDGYLGRTGSNGALITTNMPTLSYTTGRLTLGDWTILESFNATSAASGITITFSSDDAVVHCKVTNSSTNAAAVGCSLSTRGVLLNCDCELTGASGGGAAVVAGSTSARVLACRIKGAPNDGLRLASSAVVVGNIIFACVGKTISTTSTAASPLIYGNTIVGGTGDGIDIITGTTGLQCIVNNMITDNGGYGIDGVSAANAIFAAYNRTRDNTSGADNSATDWLAATKYGHVTTDTGGAATDYVDAGSNDYNLISASPAKETGILYPQSIGALPYHATASGGVPSFGPAGPLFKGKA